MLGLKRQDCVAGISYPSRVGGVVCPSLNKQEERGKMKNKSKVTHNIAIAAECPPIWDVADITQVVVDALSPTGVYARDIEVTERLDGRQHAIAVSAIMGIFGFGLAYGTLAIANAAGHTIMHLAERRRRKPATVAYEDYHSKDKS
jgi:hypothetical protein